MRVIIQDLRIHAHHGVLPQETTIGTYFTINVELDTDFTHAMLTDELEGTVSYADVFNIIKHEMATPSKLLEHVGGRICHALLEAFPTVTNVHLRIIKENPPMGADCKGAGIEMDMAR